jgi:hypothetical protein
MSVLAADDAVFFSRLFYFEQSEVLSALYFFANINIVGGEDGPQLEGDAQPE